MGNLSRRIGLVGRKVGMTRVFTNDGVSVPVTVIDSSHNPVAQVKTHAIDGYSAVQVAFGKRRASNLGKAVSGHLAKAGVAPAAELKEFPISDEELEKFKPGDPICVSIFSVGEKVDVTGKTIGKGFSGCHKRHKFKSQPASHGNSVSHNAPGLDWYEPRPGRVFPRSAWRDEWNLKRTQQNLEVVAIDVERSSVRQVKGAVPGSKGSNIVIRAFRTVNG